ncbi:hypothetical protein GGR51DRAFT_565081 [Nemania sp. FL0031]|nr:hypothetical protein GGR51DRAFT_565081 [Nemania sp. FL0031]
MSSQVNGEDGVEPPPPPPPSHVEPVLHGEQPESAGTGNENGADKDGDKDGDKDASHHPLRDSKGWDGKLRVNRSALVENPEALSDPEYSDENNVLPGEEINADEDLLDDEEPDTTFIQLTQSRVASIPNLRLERFQQVTQLCLRQNVVQNIEGLSAIAATLKELDLYDNLISHIRGLDDLTELTYLDLSFNKIKHIKHIAHLTKLKDLYFVSNKISRIEGLDTLVNLRQIELGSNRIREIQGLDALKNLEQLWLAKNKITELHGLAGLPKLKLLSVQSNRITDLTPLREVPHLQELYISHNAIESLGGLEHNVNLTMLDITHNQIKSLKGLGAMKDLKEVWAGDNQISSFTDIERELADKEHLREVYFERNPIQNNQPALYRNKVRLTLPQIEKLDASLIKTT